jgi:hypothetical protein
MTSTSINESSYNDKGKCPMLKGKIISKFRPKEKDS